MNTEYLWMKGMRSNLNKLCLLICLGLLLCMTLEASEVVSREKRQTSPECIGTFAGLKQCHRSSIGLLRKSLEALKQRRHYEGLIYALQAKKLSEDECKPKLDAYAECCTAEGDCSLYFILMIEAQLFQKEFDTALEKLKMQQWTATQVTRSAPVEKILWINIFWLTEYNCSSDSPKSSN